VLRTQTPFTAEADSVRKQFTGLKKGPGSLPSFLHRGQNHPGDCLEHFNAWNHQDRSACWISSTGLADGHAYGSGWRVRQNEKATVGGYGMTRHLKQVDLAFLQVVLIAMVVCK